MDTNQNQMGGLSIQNQSDLDSLPGNDPRQRISAVSQVVKIQMFTEIYNAGKQAERGVMVLGITDPNTNHKRVSTKVFIPKDRQDYVLTTLLEVLRSSKISGTRRAAIQSNHSALFTSLSNYKRGGEVDVQTGKQQAILRLLEDMDWSINSIPQKELIEFKEVSRSTYQEWLAETLSTDLTFTPNQAETPGREEKASGKLELIDRLLTVPTYYSNDPDRPAELVMKNTLLQALFPSVSLGQVHFGDDPMLIRNRYNGAEMDIITSGAKRGSVFFSQGQYSRVFWDNPEDAVAYGSNLMSECRHMYQGGLRIMIVKDGVFETGDCHAKMSPELAGEVGARDRAIQYRLGYLEKVGTQTSGLLMKGTAVVHPACALHNVDLIIPESSFKSTLKVKLTDAEDIRIIEVPQAAFGVFRFSKLGRATLSHTVLQYFSVDAIKKDILPHMCAEADNLQELSFWMNPGLGTVAGRRLDQGMSQPGLGIFSGLSKPATEDEDDDHSLNSAFERTTWITAYDTERILKDIPQIQRAYTEGLGRRWREVAVKGAVSWPSGIGLPTTELKDREICCHHLPEGEYIMIRYPLRYEHDAVLVRNKYLPDSGKMIEGSIWMNSITAAMVGGDFDGDQYVLGEARLFPHMAAEVRKRAARRYEIDIPKDKMRSQWSQERIVELLQSFAENHIGRLTNLGIRAYAHLEEEVVRRIPFEIQKAVMMFKHNVRPDMGWVAVQEERVPPLAWLMGEKDTYGKKCKDIKDSRTYIDYPIVAGLRDDPITRMILWTNRRWEKIQLRLKSSREVDGFRAFRKKEYIAPETCRLLNQAFRHFNTTTNANKGKFQQGRGASRNYYKEVEDKLFEIVRCESESREQRMISADGRELNKHERNILFEYCTEKCAYMAMHTQIISKYPEGRFGIHDYQNLLKKVNRTEKDFHISGTFQKTDPAVSSLIEKTFNQVRSIAQQSKNGNQQLIVPEALMFIEIKAAVVEGQDGAPKKIFTGYLTSGNQPSSIALGEIQNFTKPGNGNQVWLRPGTYLCELTDMGDTVKFKGFIDATKLKATNTLVSSRSIEPGAYSVLVEPIWVSPDEKKVIVYQNIDDKNVRPMGYLDSGIGAPILSEGRYEVAITRNEKTDNLELTTYLNPLAIMSRCPSKSQRFQNQVDAELGSPDKEARRIFFNQLATKLADREILDHLARNPHVSLTKTPFCPIGQSPDAGGNQEVEGVVYNLILKTFNPITQTVNGYTTCIAAYENQKTGVRVNVDLAPLKKQETFNSNIYFQSSSALRATWSSEKGIWSPPDKVYLFNSFSELQAASRLKKDEMCCFLYSPFKELDSQGVLQPVHTLPEHVQEWVRRYNLPLTVSFADTKSNREQAHSLMASLRKEIPSVPIMFQPPREGTWEKTLQKEKTGVSSEQPVFDLRDPDYYVSVKDPFRQTKFLETVGAAHGKDIADELRKRLDGERDQKSGLRMVEVDQKLVVAPLRGDKFIEVSGSPDKAEQVFIFENTLSALKFSRDLRRKPPENENFTADRVCIVSAERSLLPIDQIYQACQGRSFAAVSIVKTDTSDNIIMKTLTTYHSTLTVMPEAEIRRNFMLSKLHQPHQIEVVSELYIKPQEPGPGFRRAR